MSVVTSGNLTHDKNVAGFEATRQTAVANAANQAAVRAAELTFHKAVLASAQANGVMAYGALMAINELKLTG